MSTVSPINKLAAKVLESQQQLTVASPWQAASADSKKLALQREQFLQPLLNHLAQGVSANVAIRNVLQNIESKNYSERYLQTAYGLGRKGKLPSRATIHNWINAYNEHGRDGLLNKFTGRVRQDRGWEALAIQLFNIPSKPAYSAVAQQLREKYEFSDASDSAVRAYLKSLPATLNESSPMRLGKKYHALNRGKYVSRSTDGILVGEIYEGDGHTVDCYVAHPNTGKPYRPELTVWIDIRSHKIVGWYMSEAESANSTLFALSHALVKHQHVPAWLHIDNGAGFKAKILNDESVGFYSRFDISTTFAIPGNSKGKGLVEGWFRPFRDKHDKFFNGGVDYCGHDMAEETNRRLSIEIDRGHRSLRPLAEYVQSVGDYIERYNQRPQKSLEGKSPDDLWQTLERVELAIPDAAVVRPSVQRTAQRCTITLHNRVYEHVDLAHYDTRKVEVQYDLHDDKRVWIYDDKKRLVCIAALKTKKAWMPASRIEEGRQKREKGRIKRLERKIENVRLEEREAIQPDEHIESIEAMVDDILITDESQTDDSADAIYDTLELLDAMDDDEDEQ